mmetsp:Transcript_35736/g.79986  ORF Transcript_35736/g.79986 Transcript_35736/m.79986 type:complete len:232 (+) Transcript_35736:34-729(+)
MASGGRQRTVVVRLVSGSSFATLTVDDAVSIRELREQIEADAPGILGLQKELLLRAQKLDEDRLLTDYDMGDESVEVTLVLVGSNTDLAAKLESMNERERFEAAQSLRYLGVDALQHAQKLVMCFADSSDYVREEAAQALANMGPAAHDIAIAKLQDLSWQVRHAAVRTVQLASAQPEFRQILRPQLADDLLALLSDPSEKVSSCAALALGNLQGLAWRWTSVMCAGWLAA